MDFVRFQNELRPVPHTKPGKKYRNDSETLALVNSKRMNICDAKHDRLRAVLMDASRAASVWILKYFIASEDVVVSSREHFIQSLETWMDDPCDNGRRDGNTQRR